MQLHLDDETSPHRRRRPRRAGPRPGRWHTTGDVDVRENITHLPALARPELNVWQHLRSNWLSSRVFDTYEAIIDAACEAWTNLMKTSGTITSIGMRSWAHVGQSP